MRITSGTLKGRKLKSPGSLKIRPPLDQLKQSVFNILAGEIEGKIVLDLFSGTGSFGLEALSRGAARVVFVDSSYKACRLLKENLARLKAEGSVQVICGKVNHTIEELVRQDFKFDLVFVDPPFPANQCQKTLDKIAESGILSQVSLVILHHHFKEGVESHSGELEMVRQRKFGDNLVSIFLNRRKEKK
ncbi:MAG: 16S rRNA (guanine(966)-N(2))-methyltransferase RsmD [candidate division Zixibacteria bacterium RBG_16_50_21]|nr:MAG: 16S rRNA (guanine(966)-N(2))-methyltransferase RsmD [candidate division Zixibacteria bacterium RBG_16_50_21]